MASGFGAKGNEGRCYKLWKNFSGCMSTADDPSDCIYMRADYIECLHHRNEVINQNTVTMEAEKLGKASIARIKADKMKELSEPWEKIKELLRDVQNPDKWKEWRTKDWDKDWEEMKKKRKEWEQQKET
uniref:NADH dehydrogenase [ubiquinone] iron-sulfur protein 5 n=1 Tax=Mantoniella antarctica TaxID=81844 RepID=A0A7S0SRJ3_9CHLO|mmetsp:Transcript_12061/g.19460  ORF Transcript_12061/g.19460 Transcript_12061/m.19460 type:complete len:129 (+) Transcript_12061:122-508(+)|eukprot:CAMPEP_0181373398 /NCGR_PEP_ID=MMETSP1106-20121128/15355_1 /TAXON_ID=81844 /ORGANISM="Mantoniella antarctica, Strain SL-175" /LENGTH=128 /DNA_ID=CAMNT_0023491089 /DNA_START=67 /DNA_END=453 /DNA_ORIENTATION=-